MHYFFILCQFHLITFKLKNLLIKIFFYSINLEFRRKLISNFIFHLYSEDYFKFGVLDLVILFLNQSYFLMNHLIFILNQILSNHFHSNFHLQNLKPFNILKQTRRIFLNVRIPQLNYDKRWLVPIIFHQLIFFYEFNYLFLCFVYKISMSPEEIHLVILLQIKMHVPWLSNKIYIYGGNKITSCFSNQDKTAQIFR